MCYDEEDQEPSERRQSFAMLVGLTLIRRQRTEKMMDSQEPEKILRKSVAESVSGIKGGIVVQCQTFQMDEIK